MKPIGQLLVRLWRATASGGDSGRYVEEPLPYRAWKWLWQRAPRVGAPPDLFDRLASVEWDVVILLDACRYDTLRAVAGDAVVGRARSPASATPGFLDRVEAAGVFDGAIYVSGNPQTDDRRLGRNVEHVPVYEDGWDDAMATVRPGTVYDAVRSRLDEGRPVVAHTMQPHYPHIARIGDHTIPVPNGLHPRSSPVDIPGDQKLQALLSGGDVALADARQSYRAATRFAWTEASAFAADLAADGRRVVVTADHGELFGEYGLVEHPVGVRADALAAVPWVVFEPGGEEADSVPGDTADRLAALGYVER
jgi:hypothetical protein